MVLGSQWKKLQDQTNSNSCFLESTNTRSSGYTNWLPLGNSLETLRLPGTSRVASNPLMMGFQREQTLWSIHNLQGCSEGQAGGQKCQPPSFGLRKPPVWTGFALKLRRQCSVHHCCFSVLGGGGGGFQVLFLNPLKATDTEKMKCPQQWSQRQYSFIQFCHRGCHKEQITTVGVSVLFCSYFNAGKMPDKYISHLDLML